MSGRAVKGGPLSEGAGRCCDSWDVCRERLRWRASRDELGVRTGLELGRRRVGWCKVSGLLWVRCRIRFGSIVGRSLGQVCKSILGPWRAACRVECESVSGSVGVGLGYTIQVEMGSGAGPVQVDSRGRSEKAALSG